MKKWLLKKLGEVADFTNGGAWRPDEYVESGIPVVRVSDIQNETINLQQCKYLLPESISKYKKHTLFQGDLVIATVGSHPTQPGSVVGRPGIVPQYVQGALLNQNAVRIAPANNYLDKKYLAYLGKSQFFRNYIIRHARGSANQVRMSIGLLKEMEVLLPPLPIQRKIAAILSAYDRLIENNTRRIEILEEMARSIYREWFVKFRFPGHEQVQMVDSELGLIPEGWEVGRLDDALILQRGFDLPTQQRKEGNIPIYASTGVTGTHNEAKVKAPGVVTGRSGSLGTVIYIDEDFWPLNTTLWVKEFRRVTPLYAFYLFSDLKLEQYNSGAAVPTLNRNDIHGQPVVIPPPQILEHLNLFVEPLLVLKKNLLKRSDNLRQTRDLLLPRLISGEIDVENLDINTGEIAA
jgi:type I restriction enzyme, S subunit